MGSFLNFTIVCDNSLIISIIAINMTVIGLTSLAENKNIIGIDYGKFLIKKYKVLNIIRIYYLLIIFAIVNIISLFVLFIKNTKFTLIIFVVLVLSLIFAIYYFFAYVMVESKYIKRQIYEQELLGFYYKSENVTTFEVDKLVQMSNGSRTEKKLSSNVINYFNKFDNDTQRAFIEIFGPKSILYDYSNKMNKKRKNMFNKEPYDYRKSKNDIWDISHEFFQLFRFTELQDKWTIEILRIMNTTKDNNYDILRLYNFSRVITHINVFGNCEAIYKYKFLEYMAECYCTAIKISDVEKKQLDNIEQILKVEEYSLEQLLDYIIKAIKTKNDPYFKDSARKVINDIIFHEKYTGMLLKEKKFKIILNKILDCNENSMENIFTEIILELYSTVDSNKILECMKKEKIKEYISGYRKKKNEKIKITVEELFGVN